MKRLITYTLILAALVVPYFAKAHVAALDVLSKPADIPIVDQANVLTPEQEQALAQKISRERESTGNQIGVLIVPTLDSDSLEEYSIKVARDWGIGTKEKNNGVLLLVAIEDKKLRIEVGYGLEGTLTDLRSSRIIRDRITPEFQKGNYYQGIDSGLDGIIAAIHNEGDSTLKTDDQPSQSQSGFPWELFIFGALFIPSWLASVLARTKSWWAGGVIGAVMGAVVSIFAGFLIIGLLSIIGLSLMGFLLDRAVSHNYRQRRDAGLAPSWWAGGTHIGGGGGSGGFGGFGGGSFGGGGSSGSW